MTTFRHDSCIASIFFSCLATKYRSYVTCPSRRIVLSALFSIRAARRECPLINEWHASLPHSTASSAPPPTVNTRRYRIPVGKTDPCSCSTFVSFFFPVSNIRPRCQHMLFHRCSANHVVQRQRGWGRGRKLFHFV